MSCACRESWELYSTKHIGDLATLNATTMIPAAGVSHGGNRVLLIKMDHIILTFPTTQIDI